MSPQRAYGLFGHQVRWLHCEDVGIDIDWSDDGYTREWRVRGAESGERRRYELEWRIKDGRFVPTLTFTPCLPPVNGMRAHRRNEVWPPLRLYRY
jgi:hypothetical protein